MTNLNVFNKNDRVEISKLQYHRNKTKLNRGTEIVAVPQKINNDWAGYKYYVRKDVADLIKAD